jgi:hypothetical protein
LTEIISGANSLSQLGLAGVAAVAIAFAWYQTKRIERITDTLLDKFSGALVTAAQIFDLNLTDQEKEEKPSGTNNKKTKP